MASEKTKKIGEIRKEKAAEVLRLFRSNQIARDAANEALTAIKNATNEDELTTIMNGIGNASQTNVVVNSKDSAVKEEKPEMSYDWNSPNHWSKLGVRQLARIGNDMGYNTMTPGGNIDRGNLSKLLGAIGEKDNALQRQKLYEESGKGVLPTVASFAFPVFTEKMRGNILKGEGPSDRWGRDMNASDLGALAGDIGVNAALGSIGVAPLTRGGSILVRGIGPTMKQLGVAGGVGALAGGAEVANRRINSMYSPTIADDVKTVLGYGAGNVVATPVMSKMAGDYLKSVGGRFDNNFIGKSIKNIGKTLEAIGGETPEMAASRSLDTQRRDIQEQMGKRLSTEDRNRLDDYFVGGGNKDPQVESLQRELDFDDSYRLRELAAKTGENLSPKAQEKYDQLRARGFNKKAEEFLETELSKMHRHPTEWGFWGLIADATETQLRELGVGNDIMRMHFASGLEKGIKAPKGLTDSQMKSLRKKLDEYYEYNLRPGEAEELSALYKKENVPYGERGARLHELLEEASDTYTQGQMGNRPVKSGETSIVRDFEKYYDDEAAFNWRKHHGNRPNLDASNELERLYRLHGIEPTPAELEIAARQNPELFMSVSRVSSPEVAAYWNSTDVTGARRAVTDLLGLPVRSMATKAAPEGVLSVPVLERSWDSKESEKEARWKKGFATWDEKQTDEYKEWKARQLLGE